MAKFTFHGGIHPYDGKDLSKDKPMKTIVPKGEMVYPLSQHIGAPAKALIKKGDKINSGDLIAQAADGLSVPVNSSVVGTVRELTDEYAVIKC